MAEFINGTYNDSEELRVQGSFRDIRPYFKQGYSKVREDNGNWILSKPASLEMTSLSAKTVQVLFMEISFDA